MKPYSELLRLLAGGMNMTDGPWALKCAREWDSLIRAASRYLRYVDRYRQVAAWGGEMQRVTFRRMIKAESMLRCRLERLR